MKRGFRKGFTLIELLIVLAVIAALLAVVTPIALNAVRRANLTKIASNLRNIKTAAETYVTMTNPSTTTEDLLTELEGDYLTTSPGDGYSAALTYDENTGDITVTIKYTGSDVSSEEDINKLQEIYSEVTNVGDENNPVPGVKFEIKSW